MHPVGYLLEDIYRNYWGIAPEERDRSRTLLVRPRRLFGKARPR
jgi:hypothetical protein